MVRGVRLEWLRTPNEDHKRALFLGTRRLNKADCFVVRAAETRGEIRAEVGQVTNGFVDSFVFRLTEANTCSDIG